MCLTPKLTVVDQHGLITRPLKAVYHNPHLGTAEFTAGSPILILLLALVLLEPITMIMASDIHLMSHPDLLSGPSVPQLVQFLDFLDFRSSYLGSAAVLHCGRRSLIYWLDRPRIDGDGT